MLACDALRVVPATIHIALNKVPESHLNIVDHREMSAFEHKPDKRIWHSRPAYCVCGLNPHAGENGRMGHEDETIILPAINSYRPRVSTPQAPIRRIRCFTPEARKTYNAVWVCTMIKFLSR